MRHAFLLCAVLLLSAATGANGLIRFPNDHGAHPAALTEWWHFVGHLKADTGRTFGYQLTIFKYSSNAHFAHVAITDDRDASFSFSRRFYASANVVLREGELGLRYGAVEAYQRSRDVFEISGAVEGGRFALVLQMVKEPLLAAGTGTLVMPEGESSYYSLTRLQTAGTLERNGEQLTVSGHSWLDHQWGRFAVMRTRWDWFAIQMDDGTDYNIYSFRGIDGRDVRQLVGISFPDGTSTSVTAADIRRLRWWTSPATGQRYAGAWEIHLPETGERFVVEPTVADQELSSGSILDMAPTYWEGRTRVVRRAGNAVTAGAGYAEQFPY